MQYVDQYARDLEYKIFDTNIDTSQISILQTKAIKIKGIQVNVCIIGESHIVEIEDILTEVFACVNLKENPIMDISLKNGEDHIRGEISHGSVALNFSIKVLEDKNMINEHISYFEDSDLIVEFPSKENAPFKAITALKISIIKDLLHVESLHSYPNEGRIVLTTEDFHVKGNLQ